MLKVRNGQLEDSDWPKLQAAMKNSKPPYLLMMPHHLHRRARARAQESLERAGWFRYDNDYFKLMQVAGGGEGRNEITEISRA